MKTLDRAIKPNGITDGMRWNIRKDQELRVCFLDKRNLIIN